MFNPHFLFLNCLAGWRHLRFLFNINVYKRLVSFASFWFLHILSYRCFVLTQYFVIYMLDISLWLYNGCHWVVIELLFTCYIHIVCFRYVVYISARAVRADFQTLMHFSLYIFSHSTHFECLRMGICVCAY